MRAARADTGFIQDGRERPDCPVVCRSLHRGGTARVS
jgi:hypothetical protein